eukprot:gene16935-22427_t
MVASNVTIKSKSLEDVDIVEHLRKHHDVSNDGIDDTVTAIIDCNTTSGNIVIDVRSGWGPLGSNQFLELIKSNHFNDLPFYRVCPRYVTQFGVKYNYNIPNNIKVIKDDPSLWGKRDMDFGYVFFAGSGPNSRQGQMVFALCERKGCITSGLGSAPWEVPVGTIRKESFQTLYSIAQSGFPYPKLELIGQHPKAAGPIINKLIVEKDYLKTNYPSMQYFHNCQIRQSDLHLNRPLSEDHPDTDVLSHKQISDSNNKSSSYVSPLLSHRKRDSYRVKMKLVTTKGEDDVIVEIYPDWAPFGAQRFKDLASSQFFDGSKFFRSIKNFVVQFGINGNPLVYRNYSSVEIPDDPTKQTNSRGTLTFASSGPNTRSCQLFFNLVDNKYLDHDFAPIGRVVHGMDVIDSIYLEYGEGGKGDGSDGKGPDQGRITREGNAYLEKYFPKLSFILATEII